MVIAGVIIVVLAMAAIPSKYGLARFLKVIAILCCVTWAIGWELPITTRWQWLASVLVVAGVALMAAIVFFHDGF